jgi:hypothetical protein
MFVLIENYQDDVDSDSRLVGIYKDMGTAQTVMHGLYMQAKERIDPERIDMDYIEDDRARLWCPNGGEYDFFDWYIFDGKDCIY